MCKYLNVYRVLMLKVIMNATPLTTNSSCIKFMLIAREVDGPLTASHSNGF